MLWESFQQLGPLPPLTAQQRQLIAAFFDVDQDVTELANVLNQDLFETVTQLQNPAASAWITALITLKNNERRNRALRSLDAALTNDHNPNNIRRAATRILRHFEIVRPSRATNRAIEVDCFESTSMRTSATCNDATSSGPKDLKIVARGEQSEPLEANQINQSPEGAKPFALTTKFKTCNDAQPPVTAQSESQPFDGMIAITCNLPSAHTCTPNSYPHTDYPPVPRWARTCALAPTPAGMLPAHACRADPTCPP